MFEEILKKIRLFYNTNLKKTIIVCSIILAVFGIAAIVVDWLLPFKGWATFLRAFLVIPIIGVFFVFEYMFALHANRVQRFKDPSWKPYRARFSLKWRRRFAIIVAAIIFVLAYASGHTPVYTILNGFYLSLLVCALAFIRPTKKEDVAEQFSLPDERDVKYEEYLKKFKEERAKKSKKDDDDDDEFDEDEFEDEDDFDDDEFEDENDLEDNKYTPKRGRK